MIRFRGQKALESANRVLVETEKNLKTLLSRGDLSMDVNDERETIAWMMRVKSARQKIASALRRSDRW